MSKFWILAILGGVVLIAIGVASVAAGWLYTGGPWPLGYHGLGDLFVFLFFGLVATCGTAYAQLLAIHMQYDPDCANSEWRVLVRDAPGVIVHSVLVPPPDPRCAVAGKHVQSYRSTCGNRRQSVKRTDSLAGFERGYDNPASRKAASTNPNPATHATMPPAITDARTASMSSALLAPAASAPRECTSMPKS